MRRYFFLLLVCIAVNALAQTPQVPSVIDFAGMKLHLNNTAQRQIQADVDNLRRSETYFRRRMKKVDLHFPIIEKVFREENLPDDFKYLVIQESALVSDAVSSSNAVGFWQFKKVTGLEMNLRIDNEVDERLNLVSSSRAAAGYLKKNNFYYDNWIYALLAYNTGRGGAERYVKERNFGKRKMDITGNTHWYVKKFLAHKIAYEAELGKSENSIFLFEYKDGGGQSLREIAREFEVDYELLLEYNKCFKRKRVPTDKTYSVIIPLGNDQTNLIAEKAEDRHKHEKETGSPGRLIGRPSVKEYYSEASHFPVVENSETRGVFSINGRDGTIAKPGDSFEMLAARGDISTEKFFKYNDLTNFDQVKPGQVYYFQRKYSKAKTHYHTLMPGQTLWEVSQKYGLKLKKLLSKNRLDNETDAKAGLVLWLRYIRPRSIPAEYHDVQPPEKQQDNIAERKDETRSTPPAAVEKPQKPYLVGDVPEGGEYLFEEETQETPAVKVEEKVSTTQQPEEENIPDEEPAAEAAPPAARATNNTIHEVKKGETFFSISRMYGIDVADLLAWNNLRINDVLSIGQQLAIKKPAGTPQNMTSEPPQALDRQITIHKVTDDDTLYGIAKKYQVTIKDIMEWNAKEDFVIKSGEELKIFHQ